MVERLENAGIPISDITVPPTIIVEGLRELGIQTSSRTIRRIRSHDRSGEFIARKVEIEKLLKNGDARMKDKLYYSLASHGLNSRTELTSEDKHRFSSLGFITSIAEEAKLSEDVVRRCIRAMRIDFTSARPEMNEETMSLFSEIAEKYLHDYTTGKKLSRAIGNLNAEWGRTSISDFYRIYYKELTPTTLGTWPSYEMEIFQNFYEKRVNNGSALSVFDRHVLEAHISNKPENDFNSGVRKMSSVPYDYHVGDHHVNALLYGRP